MIKLKFAHIHVKRKVQTINKTESNHPNTELLDDENHHQIKQKNYNIRMVKAKK